MRKHRRHAFSMVSPEEIAHFDVIVLGAGPSFPLGLCSRLLLTTIPRPQRYNCGTATAPSSSKDEVGHFGTRLLRWRSMERAYEILEFGVLPFADAQQDGYIPAFGRNGHMALPNSPTCPCSDHLLRTACTTCSAQITRRNISKTT